MIFKEPKKICPECGAKFPAKYKVCWNCWSKKPANTILKYKTIDGLSGEEEHLALNSI